MSCAIINSLIEKMGVIIGAGAVVAKDIANYSIAVGNPARVVRVRN